MILGHSLASVHDSQAGLREAQTRRPCRINRWLASVHDFSGSNFISSNSTFTGSSCSVSPRRRASRPTCVSTVMPGVLMLEALAQAAAVLSFETLGQSPDDKTVYYFAGIDGARFKRPVEPGDQLILEAELDRMKSGVFKFSARATVDGELAVEAQLICTMRPFA